MSEEPLDKKVERLLARLLDDCVVPFVGAGVSQNARIPTDEDFQPTVSFFQHRLLKRFEDEFPEKTTREFDWELIVSREKYLSDLLASLETYLGELDEEFRKNECLKTKYPAFGKKNGEIKGKIQEARDRKNAVSFDRLAEVGEWLWGQAAVCDTLEIQKFAKLEPLPAHQYLAFLAREGLVTEIVSTNYDCCIEKAFIGSFGDRKKGEEALAVVKNLEDYRQQGGRRRTANPGRRPVLHLYKINGCAQSLNKDLADKADDDKEDEIARQIVLTERQLQNFRKEKWAEELFKDRARRRNFLFAGFGSEEPQIRHTALSIAGEFENAQERLKIEEARELPNAPFLCAYQKPSFAQLQIMTSFFRSHCKDCGTKSERDKITSWKENTFAGVDAEDFGASGKKLSADLFFKRLYQAAFRKLVEIFSVPGTVFHEWLTRSTDCPGKWRSELLQGLFDTEPEAMDIQQEFDCYGDISKNRDFLKKTIGRRRCLLELPGESDGDGRGAMLLWRWLWKARHPEEDASEIGMWYLPVREDPLFVLVALLFLVALTSSRKNGRTALHCPGALVTWRKGFGLRIGLNNGGKEKNGRAGIVLIHERALVAASRRNKGIERAGRLERCILIPSSSRRGTVKERLMIERPPDRSDSATKELWVGIRILASARDLVGESESAYELRERIRVRLAQMPLNRSRVRLKRRAS